MKAHASIVIDTDCKSPYCSQQAPSISWLAFVYHRGVHKLDRLFAKKYQHPVLPVWTVLAAFRDVKAGLCSRVIRSDRHCVSRARLSGEAIFSILSHQLQNGLCGKLLNRSPYLMLSGVRCEG